MSRVYKCKDYVSLLQESYNSFLWTKKVYKIDKMQSQATISMHLKQHGHKMYRCFLVSTTTCQSITRLQLCKTNSGQLIITDLPTGCSAITSSSFAIDEGGSVTISNLENLQKNYTIDQKRSDANQFKLQSKRTD